MMSFAYTDSDGVERVMRAPSLDAALATVKRIEHERSGSYAAAEISARTVSPLRAHDTVDGPLGHLEAS